MIRSLLFYIVAAGMLLFGGTAAVVGLRGVPPGAEADAVARAVLQRLSSSAQFMGERATLALAHAGANTAPVAAKLVPEPPAPADMVAAANGKLYPWYFPMDGLVEPEFVIHICRAPSIAAGELVTCDGDPVHESDKGAPRARQDIYGGVVFVYEPGDYGDLSPATLKYTKWLDGARIVHRSAVPGEKAVFRPKSSWASLTIRGNGESFVYDEDGERTGGRIHVEIEDMEVHALADDPNDSGALWIKTGPVRADDALMTVVVRRSDFSGGRNALFVTAGMTMLYAEDSAFHSPRGNAVELEHVAYVNGILSSHYRNVRFYGQQAKGAWGGHQLKDKAALRILENVVISNAGGVADPSNRVLLDASSWGWTWVDGLVLERVASERPRDALIQLRRESYHWGTDPHLPGAGAGAFEVASAENWRMSGPPSAGVPEAAPFLHVFRDVTVTSARVEPYVLSLDGALDVAWKAEESTGRPMPATAWADAVANPLRDKAVALSFDASGDFETFSSPRGSWWEQAGPLVYTFDDPAALPPVIERLATDKHAFVDYALDALAKANPGVAPYLTE